MAADNEQSLRKQILDATFVVVSRTGRRKLQLLEVAAEAGVSRPTVYRYFGSKEGLLEAFALYEQDNFNAGVAAATAGLRGSARVDAALQFIVDHQFSHSLAVLVDMEPEYSLAQMMRVLPTMQEGMRHIMTGENPDIAAAAVVRIAICHYLVRGHDRASFLAELRHAAGLDPRRKRGAAARSSIRKPANDLGAKDLWALQMKEVPDAVD
ncbi:MAG: TetR family transcriptional regulator [Mycobacterium sp.]|jgi:AcrR family transcriptional regulator|nr:TetR family transcriptional regulator [Mycobacterium sp.]